MSYEHVCVRVLWGCAGIVAVWCVLLLFYFLDEDMRRFRWSSWCLVGTVLGFMGSFFLLFREKQSQLMSLGFFCIILYLAVSTTMDILLKQVTDVVHYLGLLGGGILLLQASTQSQEGVELMLYVIIQYGVFRKMYGHADVIGFVLCALFFSVTGRGIDVYIGHMSLTFGMLALVQAFRRNIAADGNLKHPVALFPYIMCSFLLIF